MKNKDWFTSVRFSHLTKHAGVGSIVRDKNDLVMCVTDTSAWPEEHLKRLYAVERVKRHLAINSDLMLPPQASMDSDSNLKVIGGAIPAIRFPSWCCCDKCGTLIFKPWENSGIDIGQKINCNSCPSGIQTQVTWCAVSTYGDLLDVPWHRICHRQPENSRQEQCREELNEAYLKLKLNDLGRWEVYCTRCHAVELIEQTDLKDSRPRQPWRNRITSNTNEQVIYTVMEINDPRVFSSVSERALVIPPESDIDKESLSYKLMQESQLLAQLKEPTRALQFRRITRQAIRMFRCSEEELFGALQDIEREQSSESVDFESITTVDMIADEYNALITERDFSANADFITTHYTVKWQSYLASLLDVNSIPSESKLVDKLVAVNRLRVIEVYKGFQRRASDADSVDEIPMVPPDLIGAQHWLPAIELFGEGIFFSLKQDYLEEWEQHDIIRYRAQEIEQRYQDSDIVLSAEAIPTPRFILLHTLAHAFIRELESSAGYPAASLQERIYSSAESKMAGILIYTAVPDVAGSLGGIVEQVQPSRFIRLMDSVFRKIEWCSMDPVCGDSEGQGPSWLNKAACHGCVLVPDTSCSYSNVFLDRAFIKGLPAEGIPPLREFVRD